MDFRPKNKILKYLMLSLRLLTLMKLSYEPRHISDYLVIFRRINKWISENKKKDAINRIGSVTLIDKISRIKFVI
jgi:hypothetical protein